MVSSSGNPIVGRLRALGDPLEQAAQCQEFVTNGQRTLEAVRALRDDAIRRAHTGKLGTIDEIAAQIKARRNVVVDALRPKK